jgi:hypothetical protein
MSTAQVLALAAFVAVIVGLSLLLARAGGGAGRRDGAAERGLGLFGAWLLGGGSASDGGDGGDGGGGDGGGGD